jgi:hypothetical protein
VIKKGQLRVWIARDESGGIHETIEGFDSHFIVITDKYEGPLGMYVVDFMEGGQVFTEHPIDHIEHWSLLVSE